jgi:hypothetical protein
VVNKLGIIPKCNMQLISGWLKLEGMTVDESETEENRRQKNGHKDPLHDHKHSFG